MRVRSYFGLLVALVATAGGSPPAAASGFDADAFRAFVDMRVGTGQPVFWYCIGTVYTYPSGEALLRMEGIDTARLWRDPAAPGVAKQLSRKTFFYRDLQTNAPLTTWRGKPLPPIEYPYQFITYELTGDSVRTFVEQGRAPNVQKIGPSEGMQARRVRGDYVFTAPLFLDFSLPNGKRYEAFENYDFFVPGGTKVDSAQHRLSWLRYGDLPGAGKVIMHLVAWRVDAYSELPSSMREYLEKSARLWMQPPANIDEVRALQR
jgi:hypothetical protein